MKKIVVVVTLFLTSYLQAQVTKNLGDFDSVKVFDKLTVKLVPSNENKVSITGTRANEVEVINKNGEVKLRMPFPKLLSGNDIKIQLYFKKIESIDASEGSYVSSDFPFKQTILSVNAKEGAQIKVEFDTEKATIRAVSGGILDLTGKTNNQTITIASGGVLEAKDLISSQTTVNVSAGGKAEIHATTLVDAKVKAGGSIYIYGKPKQINQETILGGTIIEK
ncbi:head GIN domain-containing protein [Flavobacterium polysaccharolyticum]|uniref:Head GIN domain-containing protein n=1 Tax=Flavobacterium polysaccharolyticum TaxID=3133148 RepID=A0ABU9NSH2_9FLAO